MAAVKKDATLEPAKRCPECKVIAWENSGIIDHKPGCSAKETTTAPPERSYATPTDATRVRELLAKIGMGQREAARELEIGERDMRGYCAGDKVPRVVMLALERLVDLQRRVAK